MSKQSWGNQFAHLDPDKPPERPATASKASKMRNVPEVYNGRTYQSRKEAARAKQLDWMVYCGVIKGWTPQVAYKLEIAGVLICTYVLDFLVENLDGTFTHEDVKGRKAGAPYQLFKLKQHLMRALHGIEVKEI